MAFSLTVNEGVPTETQPLKSLPLNSEMKSFGASAFAAHKLPETTKLTHVKVTAIILRIISGSFPGQRNRQAMNLNS
jgi:hypothetical protein